MGLDVAASDSFVTVYFLAALLERKPCATSCVPRRRLEIEKDIQAAKCLVGWCAHVVAGSSVHRMFVVGDGALRTLWWTRALTHLREVDG